MCWNAEVSLNTFIFALFGFIIGYINGFNKKILLFFLLFSFIQFYEYMIWVNLDSSNINKIWSLIGFIIILLEPIASINILDTSLLKYILYILYIPGIIVVPLLRYKFDDFTTVRGMNGHLQWNWLESPKNLSSKFMWAIWFLCFFVPLIIYTIKYKKYIPLLFTLITYIITIYYYFKAGVFGTMWCWASNGIWFYVLYCSILKNHC